jgi:hypothetical protein
LAKAVDQGPQDFLYGLKLVDGAGGVPAVEREIITELPRGTGYAFHVTSVVEDQVNQSIEPETTALGVFGAIALLAGLLIAGQAVGRQLAQNESEAGVLRALGAGPWALVLDSLAGIMMAVVAGTALAVGVAVAISPLSPLGPVRPVTRAGDPSSTSRCSALGRRCSSCAPGEWLLPWPLGPYALPSVSGQWGTGHCPRP